MNCRLFLRYGQSVDKWIPLDYSVDSRGALPLALNFNGELYVKVADNWYAHVQPMIVCG